MARLSLKTGKHGRPTTERGQVTFHLQDPYMQKGGWHEPTVCPECGAAFSGKKWSIDKKVVAKVRQVKDLKYAKCPGCRKIDDHFVMGMVYLSGDFIKDHKDEILHSIKNEEKKAMYKNPLERIISIHAGDDSIIVETTNDQLALRLGRFLRKTFHGSIDFKFSQDQKLVRIFWQR